MDALQDLLPAGAKRLHFIRHGEGVHNVYRKAEFDAGRTPTAKRWNIESVPRELWDPELTALGREEAKRAQAEARRCRPELLVTSPLRRAVQTLLIAYEGAVSAGVPVVAHELCREIFFGQDPSIYDSRRGRSDCQEDFPKVDFESYVLLEELVAGEGPLAGKDPLWWHCASPFGVGANGLDETAAVDAAFHFLCWLFDRPETEIAVATHSLFLLALLHGTLSFEQPLDSPQVFRTGELRSFVVVQTALPPRRGEAQTRWAGLLQGPGAT